jgi:hypothetical protein
MYVIYKLVGTQPDPRHEVLDHVWGYTLARVQDPGWVNWEQPSVRVIPDKVAEMYNMFGRPEFRGYEDPATGIVYTSKALVPGLNGIKITRPYTDEELHNVIEYMKTVLKIRVEDLFEQRYIALQKRRSAFEMSTWAEQLAEARQGGGPLLEAIAMAKGVPVGVLIGSIKSQADGYHAEIGKLLGQQLRHIRDIDVCNTLRDISIVAEEKFGIGRYSAFGETQWADYQVHI